MALDDYLNREFEVTEQTVNTSNDNKAGYYPKPGEVRIMLRKVPYESQGENPVTIDVVRADVTGGRNSWDAAEAFETAIFYIMDDHLLVSDPIPVEDTDLAFTEVFKLTEDGDSLAMDHHLLWSDGDFGFWKCIIPGVSGP